MRLKSKQVIPALAVAAILSAAPAVSARADTTASLPQLTRFQQMVVDAPAGYVFLSEGTDSESLVNGGTSTGPVVVTDLAGKYVTSVDDGDGVEGLALSPDGKTLYAALAAQGKVAAIDVSTITQATPTQTLYPLGSGETPVYLALQSGKLWVSYNDATGIGGAIGDIDISAASPAFTADVLPQPSSSWYSAPEIAGDPSGSGVLIAAQPALSSTQAASYNVAGASPAKTAGTLLLGGSSGCGYLSDLAVVPGGTQFIPACSAPQQTADVYSSADLSVQSSYPTATWPGAIAIAANGTIATGGRNPSGPSLIDLYSPGGSSPLNTLSLSSSQVLAGHGLAWSPDGSKLYAVVQNVSSYSLNVYDDPALRSSTLALSAPGKVVIGKRYTISGKLALSAGGPLAGKTVTITRAKAGAATLHWTRTTASDGSFSLSNEPPVRGTYTYTARYAGDSASSPATATARVSIVRRVVSLWIRTSANKIRYNHTVKVTAHLGKTYRNRTLSIYARTVGSSKKVLLKRGTVNSHGYLRVWYRAPHSKVFIAVFGGDPRYQARKVWHTVGVWVRVGAKASGYYTTTRSGGHTYHVYHHTAKLKEAVHITPDKHGQCIRLQAQEYYRGSWHANVLTGCGHLNKHSNVSGYLLLTHANRGYHYRVRADYIRKNTDHSNLSTAGSWFYLIVRK